jgi:hypothetical protein
VGPRTVFQNNFGKEFQKEFQKGSGSAPSRKLKRLEF